MSLEGNKPNKYLLDVFLKYKEVNRQVPSELEVYSIQANLDDKKTNKKLIEPVMIKKGDVKMKLNFILTQVKEDPVDEKLYDQMRRQLNIISERNYDDIKLCLINLPYNKMDHFHRLSEHIIKKAADEPQFSGLYSKLCFDMAPYFIEIDSKKIYYRNVLVAKCQEFFNKYIANHQSAVKNNVVGMMKFLSDLYKNGLLTGSIVYECTEVLTNSYNNENPITYAIDGIQSLLLETLSTINKKDKSLYAIIKIKLLALESNKALGIREKILIMDVMDELKKIG
jgi:hypothetical protein